MPGERPEAGRDQQLLGSRGRARLAPPPGEQGRRQPAGCDRTDRELIDQHQAASRGQFSAALRQPLLLVRPVVERRGAHHEIEGAVPEREGLGHRHREPEPLVAAAGGSFLARAFFGTGGHLAATVPPTGQHWQAAGFEAVITFGLVLMVLNMANGPKLNGPYVPLAVGAYILAWGAMGGPFDGASMNPARSFGPDLAIHNLSTWWVYILGPAVGATVAVAVAYVLRGPAKAQEAIAAKGTPLDRAS